MINIDYVVFDYNGTITDDVEIGLESCNRVLEGLYFVPRVSMERFRETFGTPWVDFFLKNGVLEEEIHIPIHQKHYQNAHTSLAKEELKLREYAKENLQFLKQRGLRLGVLSSRNVVDLTNELKDVRVYDFFDVVIGEDHIHSDGTQAEKKTDKLIRSLGINDRSKVLYVGDMVQDVDVAREAGFISGIITGGWQSVERLKAKNPDYLFNSHLEIKQLFF